jgi:hypothetical protein
MRTVTYEIEADSLEGALEKWDTDGPEVGFAAKAVASSNIEPVEESNRLDTEVANVIAGHGWTP